MKRSISTALIAGFVLAAAATVSGGQMPPTQPGPRRLPPVPCRVTASCVPRPAPCDSAPMRRGCHPRLPPIGNR
jgi:hypothetical protein